MTDDDDCRSVDSQEEGLQLLLGGLSSASMFESEWTEEMKEPDEEAIGIEKGKTMSSGSLTTPSTATHTLLSQRQVPFPSAAIDRSGMPIVHVNFRHGAYRISSDGRVVQPPLSIVDMVSESNASNFIFLVLFWSHSVCVCVCVCLADHRVSSHPTHPIHTFIHTLSLSSLLFCSFIHPVPDWKRQRRSSKGAATTGHCDSDRKVGGRNTGPTIGTRDQCSTGPLARLVISCPGLPGLSTIVGTNL